MNKNYAKKRHYSRRPPPTPGVLRYFLWVMVIIGLIGTAYFARQYQQQPQAYPAVTSYISHVQTWLSERKNRLHQGVVQVKRLAVHDNDDDQQIHFEFYTTLPKMQVVADNVDDSADKVANNRLPKTVIQHESKTNQVASPAEKLAIANSDALEQELFTQIEETKKDQPKETNHQ